MDRRDNRPARRGDRGGVGRGCSASITRPACGKLGGDARAGRTEFQRVTGIRMPKLGNSIPATGETLERLRQDFGRAPVSLPTLPTLPRLF